MSAAWFVDGAYLHRLWQRTGVPAGLDYATLRMLIERHAGDQGIDEAYYFDAVPDDGRARGFHSFLSLPPPQGPGLRVKLYGLRTQRLFWPEALGGMPVRHPERGVQYELVQQKGVDVGLAFHLQRSYMQRHWHALYLAAGDGDLTEVVQYLCEHENVTIVLLGSLATISADLRPYARTILEIDRLAPSLARQHSAVAGSAFPRNAGSVV